MWEQLVKVQAEIQAIFQTLTSQSTIFVLPKLHI